MYVLFISGIHKLLLSKTIVSNVYHRDNNISEKKEIQQCFTIVFLNKGNRSEMYISWVREPNFKLVVVGLKLFCERILPQMFFCKICEIP